MIPGYSKTIHTYRFKPMSSLFVKAGVDFIMHDTGLYGSSNSALGDCFWNLAHGSLALYLLSEPDSEYRLRQAAASLVHVHRLLATSAVSALDLGIANIVNAIAPSLPVLSLRNSKQRALKRLLLTLVRNGGVYRDVFDFIRGISPASHDLAAILRASPFTDIDETEWEPTRAEALSLIESELNRRVHSLFSSFPSHPVEINGPFAVYDARLRGGRQVSVSIVLPRVERMRRYDLFPFKVIASVMTLIPGVSAERNLLKSLLQRLDVNVRREFEARWAILEEFGVDKDGDIREIIESSRNIDLPISVPAPLPHLTSEHVMVSDAQPHERVRSSGPSLAYSVASFTSKLSYRAGFLVPEVGLANIRVSRGRTSLARFSSLVKVERADIEATGRVLASLVTRDRHAYASALGGLGVRGRAAEPLAAGNMKLWPTVRAVATVKPDLVVNGTELAFSLAGHAASACSASVRQFMTWRDAMATVLADYSLSL